MREREIVRKREREIVREREREREREIVRKREREIVRERERERETNCFSLLRGRGEEGKNQLFPLCRWTKRKRRRRKEGHMETFHDGLERQVERKAR